MEIVQEMGGIYLCVDNLVQEENQYLLSMLINNYIENVLKCNIGYKDNKDVIKYDIANMKSLSSEYEHNLITVIKLKKILCEITKIMAKAREYLLVQEYFMLDPKYIYSDIEDGSMKLLYIPFECQNEFAVMKNRFFALADFILEKIDYKDDKAVKLAYDFYRMSREDFFSLDKFILFMEKAEGNREELYKYDTSDSYKAVGAKEEPYIYKYKDNESADTEKNDENLPEYKKESKNEKTLFSFLKKKKKNIQQDSQVYDEEDYWGEISIPEKDNDVTEFFDVTHVEGCKISWIQKGKEKNAAISEFPAVVGKKKGDATVVINEPSVSRKHISIDMCGGKVFLEDLNSTNGTYINGNKIRPGEKILIANDDKIQLGNIPMVIVQ